MPQSRRRLGQPHARALHLEPLEDRRLLSITPHLIDIRAGINSSLPDKLQNVGGVLYFSADDSGQMVDPVDFWRITPGAAAEKAYAPPSWYGDSTSLDVLAEVNGSTYFAERHITSDDLYVLDGTNVAARRIYSINPTVGGPYLIDGNLVYPVIPSNDAANVNGTLVFTANDSTGNELWRSDGTAPGTYRIADINQQTYSNGNLISSNIQSFTLVDDTLFFVANDGTHGYELWKTDGTATGTERLSDAPGLYSTDGPRYLTAAGDFVYFRRNDGAHGNELWKSDGTPGGTVMVKDIRTGTDGGWSDSASTATIGDILYFSANDGSKGFELWRTDGSEAGTYRVKDVRIGFSGSNPSNFVNVGGILYFTANDGVSGAELWKSDGTDAGTIRVADLRAGSASPAIKSMTAVGSRLYFVANDGVHGDELWRSDGTAAGTVLVSDISPPGQDDASSGPQDLVNVGGVLYFTADNWSAGREVWFVDPRGDFNGDNVVDGMDFLAWQRDFGAVANSWQTIADGDGDGSVDGGDLDVWRENFGTSGGAAASGVAVGVAALVAEEEESAGEDLAAAIVNYAGRGDRAREALFAAGDFSRLFLASGDDGAENRWGLRGRGRASLARRG